MYQNHQNITHMLLHLSNKQPKFVQTNNSKHTMRLLTKQRLYCTRQISYQLELWISFTTVTCFNFAKHRVQIIFKPLVCSKLNSFHITIIDPEKILILSFRVNEVLNSENVEKYFSLYSLCSIILNETFILNILKHYYFHKLSKDDHAFQLFICQTTAFL